MKYFFLIAILIFKTDGAFSNSLLGGASLTRDTAFGAASNPASGAFVKKSQIQMDGSFFNYGYKSVQYPGVPAWEQKSTGPGIPLSLPSFLIKLRKNIGVSGIVLPPIPITVPLPKYEGIQLYVLGQLTKSDVEVSGQLGGYIKFQGGFALTRNFALGLGLEIVSATGDAKIFPADRSDVSIDIGADVLTLTSNLSLRWNATKNISLGFKTGFASLNKTTIKTGITAFPEIEQGGSLGFNMPWKSFSLGASFKFSSLTLYLETNYSGISGNETGVSLSPPAIKPSDVYPTTSFKVGLEIKMRRNLNILTGGNYQPARLGDGSPGPDGKHGYGGLEYLLGNSFPVSLASGLAPNYSITGGVEYSFFPEYRKKSIKSGRRSRRRLYRRSRPRRKQAPLYYHASVAPGIRVKRASRGIDESGDTPASYEHFNVSANVILTYRI